MRALALLTGASASPASQPTSTEPAAAGGFERLLHGIARLPASASQARAETANAAVAGRREPDWAVPRSLRAPQTAEATESAAITDAPAANAPDAPASASVAATSNIPVDASVALPESISAAPAAPLSKGPAVKVPPSCASRSSAQTTAPELPAAGSEIATLCLDSQAPPQKLTANVTEDDKAACTAPMPSPALPAPLAQLPLQDAAAPLRPSPVPGFASNAAVAEAALATEQSVPQAVIEALTAAAPDGGSSITNAPTTVASSAAAFPTLMAAASPLPPVNAVLPMPASDAPPLAMDQADWPQRLGEQIHWRLGEGIKEARIEISPRELGQIDVRLSMDDSGLKLHLSAAHAQTRELLQSELPRLRESLQQGGVLLTDAQVGREAPGQRQGGHAGQPPMPENARSSRSGERDSDAATSSTTVWRSRKGLLDDYA